MRAVTHFAFSLALAGWISLPFLSVAQTSKPKSKPKAKTGVSKSSGSRKQQVAPQSQLNKGLQSPSADWTRTSEADLSVLNKEQPLRESMTRLDALQSMWQKHAPDRLEARKAGARNEQTGRAEEVESTNPALAGMGQPLGSGVMLPTRDLVANLNAIPELAGMVQLLQAQGLLDTLRNTHALTVLVQLAPEGSVKAFNENVPRKPAYAQEMARLHLIHGIYSLEDMVNGRQLQNFTPQPLTVVRKPSGQTSFQARNETSAVLEQGNFLSSNGVIHVVSGNLGNTERLKMATDAPGAVINK